MNKEERLQQMAQLSDLIQTMSKAELREVGRLLNLRMGYLRQLDLTNFKVGDKVHWVQNTTLHGGVITKINRKTVNVREDNGQKWRIAPSRLTKIE